MLVWDSAVEVPMGVDEVGGLQQFGVCQHLGRSGIGHHRAMFEHHRAA